MVYCSWYRMAIAKCFFLVTIEKFEESNKLYGVLQSFSSMVWHMDTEQMLSIQFKDIRTQWIKN